MESLALVFKTGGNMANVTSAIDKSIDNNITTMTAQNYLFVSWSQRS